MQFKEAVDILKEYGIAGAGGAGFPSYAKLSEKAETVILNCAECEPLFKQHRQLLEKYAFEIISTLEELRTAVGAKEFIVAVKKSYTDTVNAVSSYIDGFENGRIHLLGDFYPTGDEVITIYETTKKRVPPGGLPIDTGVVVFNVETIFNMYNAINRKTPVMYKYLTVAGEVKRPQALRVPIGMRFSEAVKLCGGEACGNTVYISGGPMTGKIASKNDCVTKTTNGILVMPENHYIVQKRVQRASVSIKRAMSSCCQCRTCTDLCSRSLLGHPIKPHAFMASAAVKSSFNVKAMLDTLYCSGCGLCEMYSCPQGLNPRSLIQAYKKGLRENGIKLEKKESFADVNSFREHRRVSEKRLTARLGLEKYNTAAPLSEESVEAKRLRISMSQSIGTPAVPVVKKGQTVSTGELIAEAGSGLSLPVHSPQNGVVISVDEKCVIVECR